MGIVTIILVSVLAVGYVIHYITNLMAEGASPYLTEKIILIAIMLACILFIIKMFIYMYYGLDKAYKYRHIIFFLILNCAAQAFMFGSIFLNLTEEIIGSGFDRSAVTIQIIVSLILIAIPSSINIGADIHIGSKLSDRQNNTGEKLDSQFLRSSCIKLWIAILANIVFGIMSNCL